MTASKKTRRYGMVIDLDRCTGCGACVLACAAENNVAAGPARVTPRTGITLMRVHPVAQGAAFIPMLCQQCGHETPCASVSPAGRRCRPRHGDRWADGGAVPRLPLLHGGLPVSRALLQLVGPGVARGNGEDAESERRAAAARGGGEMQFLPRPPARRDGEGGRRGQEGDRRRRLRAGVRGSCPTGAIVFGDLNASARAQARRASSGCSNGCRRTRRSITARRRTG